jgi:cbb3-type cytochrome oxidase subunit 3
VNNVLRAGAATAELGTWMGLATVVFVAALVGWTVWAYSPSRRERLEAAGRIPLEGGDL